LRVKSKLVAGGFALGELCRWAFRGKFGAVKIERKNMKCFIPKLANLIGKFALFFLTFLVGVTSVPLLFEISPPTVTLCEVAKNPKWYDGKTIRLAAHARTHKGIFSLEDRVGRIYDDMFSVSISECNFSESDAFISLPKDYKPTSEKVQEFLSKTHEGTYSADVLVTGKIEATPEIGNSPKFKVKVTKVELKSETVVTIACPPVLINQ
jgi:hypothetical protein